MTSNEPQPPPAFQWVPGDDAEAPVHPDPFRRTGYGRSLLATLVWAATNLVVTVIVMGPPPSPRAAGTFTAGVLVPSLLAAVLTWLIARRARPRYPFWLVVLIALPFYLLFRVVASGVFSTG